MEKLFNHYFPAQILTLNSGLTLIHQYLPAIPVAVVDVWVGAGAIAEPNDWGGMAHFLEHMIFKGTKRIAPGVFDQIVEHTGGMTNAATSHDYAHFFLTTASDYMGDTLPYLAEILLQAEIPDEEFYYERDVVLEELRGSYDDPDWFAFQNLCRSLYQYHPYGRSILGEEAQLMLHSPNQMRCFHRTHYQPENMTVVLIGNVTEKAAIALVENSFQEFGARSECPPTVIEAEPPLITIRRQELVVPNLSQARLLMGWIGPGIEQLEDGFGLDLLSAVLAGGRCSRLVREFREDKGLVLDIYSSFSLQQDSSLFTINAYLDPHHLEQVETGIQEHLYRLQCQDILEIELERAKRLLCHDYIFSTETPGQIAGLYGYYQTLASATLAVKYPLKIQQFQASDLKRLARQYLSPERYAITLMRPSLGSIG
ncbi:MAG: pitrilysin family protein [Snowella sp.]|nr:pitrilysin family protein [Snowella sp.]